MSFLSNTLVRSRTWLAVSLRQAADRLHRSTIERSVEPDQLGADTIEYVVGLAAESYKRQVDLDESVWRSLAFLAATFAFVAAIVGRAATDVPSLSVAVVPVVANLLLTAAVLSLAWTLRWFWVVLRPREYEYPADDAAVKRYAEEVTAYHAALGLTGDDLDRKVVNELRLFMIDQFSSAARTNLGLNIKRLGARARVLLFILVAFVLAFSCEATIFITRVLAGPAEVSGGEATGLGANRANRSLVSIVNNRPVHAGEADGSQVTLGHGRGRLLGGALQRQHQGEAVMPDEKSTKPPATTPARPTPPELQRIAKKDEGTRNQPRPKPAGK